MKSIENRKETKYRTKIMTDICVCCGEPVPEGRTICWKCEHQYDEVSGSSRYRKAKDISLTDSIQRKKQQQSLRLFRLRKK